jgi:FkbM family methyltransferase
MISKIKSTIKNGVFFTIVSAVKLLQQSYYSRLVVDKFVNTLREQHRSKSIAGIDFKIPVSSDLLNWRYQTFETKEPETLRWIDTFDSKDIFWDIGANIGLYSIYALKKSGCKVFAFEPSSFNLEWLHRVISLNSCGCDVVVIPVAVSSMNLYSTFRYSSTDFGGALNAFDISFDWEGEEFRSVFEQGCFGMRGIEVCKFLNIPKPTKIKIDVDGAEHLVLEGLEDVFDQVDSILIEVNKTFEQQYNSVSKMLLRKGFKLDGFFPISDNIQADERFSAVGNEIWIKNVAATA